LLTINEHKNGLKFNLLEGQMRSKDITTVNHHLNTHLIKNGMATIEKKGAIKKERFIKITDKGKSALSETLKRE